MLRTTVSLVALLATGCVKQPVALYMDTQVDGETGHYVVIAATGAGSLKVYDCLARPDGSAWNPTCVKVDMRSSPAASDSGF